MKKLILILFCITLFLPLSPYVLSAQETAAEETAVTDEDDDEDEDLDETPRRITFARQKFDFGNKIGVGFDNNLIGTADILTKEIVIDLNEWGDRIRDDGLNFNVHVDAGIFFNFLNMNLGSGVWTFGFFAGADGDVNLNLSKSLFTLITEGNVDKSMRSTSGEITAAGGVFANVGITTSAKYGRLRLGVKPSLFSPIVFIPRSGIKYQLDTEDSISLSTSGEISIYCPITEDGFDINEMRFGFDLGLESEFTIFPFLDVGGGISNIPIVPAAMKNRIRYSMSEVNLDISGSDLMNGKEIEMPEFGLSDPVYDSEKLNIFRPLRFDFYANVKLLRFDLISMTLTPSVGFSVAINDSKGYFNFGFDTYTTLLKELFKIRLGTTYQESIWNHRLGFGFNFRAFELGLDASLRSSSFAGSFSARGFGLKLGINFGW